MTPNLTQQRQAFEAWAERQGINPNGPTGREYWEVWQAALHVPTERFIQVIDVATRRIVSAERVDGKSSAEIEQISDRLRDEQRLINRARFWIELETISAV